MTATNSNLARTYAHFGVPVFPCREAGDRAKSPYVANGYHQANTHPDLLKVWASMYCGPACKRDPVSGVIGV